MREVAAEASFGAPSAWLYYDVANFFFLNRPRASTRLGVDRAASNTMGTEIVHAILCLPTFTFLLPVWATKQLSLSLPES